jgi:hypothetical protein
MGTGSGSGGFGLGVAQRRMSAVFGFVRVRFGVMPLSTLGHRAGAGTVARIRGPRLADGGAVWRASFRAT